MIFSNQIPITNGSSDGLKKIIQWFRLILSSQAGVVARGLAIVLAPVAGAIADVQGVAWLQLLGALMLAIAGVVKNGCNMGGLEKKWFGHGLVMFGPFFFDVWTM